MREDALKALEELSKIFNEAMAEVEKESEDFWNSLSKEDQLKAFCAISRRIYKGEIEDRGTYRYVLYDVFGFGFVGHGFGFGGNKRMCVGEPHPSVHLFNNSAEFHNLDCIAYVALMIRAIK